MKSSNYSRFVSVGLVMALLGAVTLGGNLAFADIDPNFGAGATRCGRITGVQQNSPHNPNPSSIEFTDDQGNKWKLTDGRFGKDYTNHLQLALMAMANGWKVCITADNAGAVWSFKVQTQVGGAVPLADATLETSQVPLSSMVQMGE